MSQHKNQRRVGALDALRGAAALAVLLFHYTVKFPDFYPAAAPSPFVFAYGFYGVHLFFMISGFVILMSLEHSQGKGFLRSRFLRLYPLYWMCVLLTFAVLSVAHTIPFPNSLPQFLVNLTMLEAFVRVEAIDGVYWSLAYELGFYFLMYAVFRGRLHRHIERLPALMAVLASLFLIAKPIVPHPFHYLLVFNAYGHLFACGMAFFFLKQRGPKLSWIGVVMMTPVIQYCYDGAPGLIAVGLSVLLMAMAVIFIDLARKISAPLLWLGAISYALYLTHQMIGYVVLSALEKAGLPAAIAIALTAAGALALASVLTYGVERPIVRYLKTRVWPAKMAPATSNL